MLSFEVLLSAMYLDSYEYINTLNIESDCVVINQCEENKVQEILSENRNIKYICTTERGLSRSRNMAIENSKADICMICDNDVEYVKGYKDIIIDAFQRNPDSDIIAFFVERENKHTPTFPAEKKLNYITSCKLSSFEIAIRRKSIIDNDIKFKTEFGAGSTYSMGEENIFLYDCLRAGLKIKYVPVKIAELRYEESTWFKGYTKKFFIDRGATFYGMSRFFSPFLNIQFAIRKYKLYKNDMSLNQALANMFKGRKKYKNSK